MKKIFFTIAVLVIWMASVAAKPDLKKVEPMFWWAGMKNPNLQLMVYGGLISQTDVKINYPGVRIESVAKVENPNYLFINLKISTGVKPGAFEILFQQKGKTIHSYPYQLKAREKGSAQREGFNTSDLIYLITPDRYVNGNPLNDTIAGMKETFNRADRNGRHGGDLRGIINSLDYLKNLGFTAVWLNPILENNMTRTSYHGYSITDFYKVDARYGSNEEYLELSAGLKTRGMVLIMDMIFNHCGSEHWWMADMPMPDWVNLYPDFKFSSHRRTVNQDMHASEADKRAMSDGWFDTTMPDLNQRNPFMATYLIQNSIWWIEYAGLAGIRQDTWPYPDKNMMAEWTRLVLEEYPDFNIVGEEWSMNPAIVSYWQKGKANSDGYKCYLPSLMDFPLQNAASTALRTEESWGNGLIQLYEALSNDFLYPDPNSLVVFPDNHDMSRLLVQVGGNVDLLKLGIAYFLTTRGIPQIYYGTEVLMSHPGDQHGDIRGDFPGGWAGDRINAFTGAGLTDVQKNMQEYVRKIANWRKNSEVIYSGKMIHFVPQDGMYVYFRMNDKQTVMVALNKNKTETDLATARFAEVMGNSSSGKDVISGEELGDIKTIKVPALSAMIIELK